jgi:hypothetical protein
MRVKNLTVPHPSRGLVAGGITPKFGAFGGRTARLYRRLPFAQRGQLIAQFRFATEFDP